MRLSQKQIILLISAALVVTTLVAYEPIRHNNFVHYDDNAYITENPNVIGGITRTSIVWAFTKPYAANWHPLTWLSHMLDCEIYGLNPQGHHITSVLIHIINCVLLFIVLYKTTRAMWPSAFVAAIFALHPLHVDSVAWAAERKDVLSGLFWMLTMLAYVYYTERPNFKRYAFVLAVFLMGLMSKPMLVTLPFALILLDWWPLNRIARHRNDTLPVHTNRRTTRIDYPKVSLLHLVAEKIPLFVLSVISSVATVIAQKSGGTIATLEYFPMDSRVGNAFISYIGYILKTLWPNRLAVLYPQIRTSFSDATVVVCMLLFVLISIFMLYAGRRRKYIAVGWLWYVGTLVPVIGIVQVGIQAMANRYMYMPMLGLLIIIAWAVKELIDWRPHLRTVAAVSATIVLSLAVILTRMQVKHWQNDMTLCEYTLKVTKNNALIENNYGGAFIEAKRFDEAALHFKKSLLIIPVYADARNNLGKVYLKQEKFSEAVACFNEVLRQNGDSTQTHYCLAVALNAQGKYNDAVKHFAAVLSLDPKYPSARDKMGFALIAANRPNEAIACFNELLRQNRDSAEAHYNLAIALGMQKKYDEAIEHLAKVLQLNPAYPEAHNKMGLALMAVGKNDEAIKYLNEGLKINKDQETYANLGSAYIQVGKYDLAIENLTKAIELKPDNIDVLNKLAWLFAVVDNTTIHNAPKAVEFAQRGCELTGYKDPMLLDTLAVAYAAAGRFDEAKATAERALNIAKETGRENLAAEIQKRIKLYEANQPYQQK